MSVCPFPHSESIVEVLLEHGASVEAHNRRKETPLMCSHNINISRALLAAAPQDVSDLPTNLIFVPVSTSHKLSGEVVYGLIVHFEYCHRVVSFPLNNLIIWQYTESDSYWKVFNIEVMCHNSPLPGPHFTKLKAKKLRNFALWSFLSSKSFVAMKLRKFHFTKPFLIAKDNFWECKGNETKS